MEKDIDHTFVGVPYHEKEPIETFHFLLENVDKNLASLGVDAKISLLINGPEATLEKTKEVFESEKEQSKYNADIELIFSNEVGRAKAVNQLIKKAQAEHVEKVFITDADLYRFPNSLKNLWEASVPEYGILGAQSVVFPKEIVSEQVRQLTDQEQFWYSVFEGDRHPTIRNIVDSNIGKEKHIRGGLLLINDLSLEADNIQPEDQILISNSIPTDKRKLVKDAVFMHFGRIDLVDHITAKLRFAKSSEQQKYVLPQINYNELITMTERRMKSVHNQIPENLLNLFYLRTALRKEVNEFINSIINNKVYKFKNNDIQINNYQQLVESANSFPEAISIINNLFNSNKNSFQDIQKNDFKNNITQPEFRTPIDVSNILDNPESQGKHLGIILDSLGIYEEDFNKL